MKIKLLLATLLFIVAFSANAQTNNLVQTGKTQLKNNQYSSAFATFKRAAANGNTEAMYYVGLCWENGFGTQQDIYEAMDWYLKAADKGNGEACFRVSWAYQDGCVAQINPVKAAEYAKKAANAGNIAGIEWYAQCLAMGMDGMKQYLNESKRFFQMAMDKNYEDAFCTLAQYLFHGWNGFPIDNSKSQQYLNKLKTFNTARGYNQLACMFVDGSAGMKSHKKAFDLYLKSANMGFIKSEYEVGRYYLFGSDDNTIAKSEALGIQWLEKSYKHGYTYAASKLGSYYEGKGQFSKALDWYYTGGDGLGASNLIKLHRKDLSQSDVYDKLTKMANGRCVWAQRLLGEMYDSGMGVAQSPNEAFKWYYKAATNVLYYEGSSGDLYNTIGNCYFNGYGVARDYSQAFKWYLKGAKCEHSSGWAQYNLANCYFNGNGVAANENAAFSWMLHSAQTGICEAMNVVAAFYISGKGTSVNYNEAYKWCKKSADNNNAEGQYCLALCYFKGYGTQRNSNLAREYLTKSANQGYEPAKQGLQQMNQSAMNVNPNNMINNWMDSWMNAAKNMKFDFSNINIPNTTVTPAYPPADVNNNSSIGIPSRKTCPACNGKRYTPDSYTDCATSYAYHNYAGNVCPICNMSTKHCHYPCNTCQQRGTIESY